MVPKWVQSCVVERPLLISGKKYRADYMSDAIEKYLTLCQTPEFAVRYLKIKDLKI